MKRGMLPKQACHHALKVVYKHYPTTKAAIVCLNDKGEFGAASIGYPAFYYTVMNKVFTDAKIFKVNPTTYT